MRRRLTGIAMAFIVITLVAIQSRAQEANPADSVYDLGNSATYRAGCFDPCLCPIVQRRGPKGDELETCAIITTEANELCQQVHDRMPVIVAPENYAHGSMSKSDPPICCAPTVRMRCERTRCRPASTRRKTMMQRSSSAGGRLNPE